MNLLFILGFILSSIDSLVGGYVAAKSLTVYLQWLISRDDIKKDLNPLGMLAVHIHRMGCGCTLAAEGTGWLYLGRL